jgi:hypothetical protein
MASEDGATKPQIKRLYAVLHSVGIDPKQWKKEKNIASFDKMSRDEISEYIDQLEDLEWEKQGERAEAIANGAQKQLLSGEPVPGQKAPAEAAEAKEGSKEIPGLPEIADLMRACVRATKEMVEEELAGLTETTRANLTERFAITIFIEARKCGL